LAGVLWRCQQGTFAELTATRAANVLVVASFLRHQAAFDVATDTFLCTLNFTPRFGARKPALALKAANVTVSSR
jgi:hypothetical protein